MLNKKLFVVCTKEGDYIKQCVEKIIAHYPEDDILVVDSDSKDKSYMDGLRKYKNVVIARDSELLADYKNKHYEYGAILYGFKNNKDSYDVFFFIQDSIYIEGEIDLSILDEESVLVFSDFRKGWSNWTTHETKCRKEFPEFFNHPNYVHPNNLLMVQFNSFIITSSTFDKCIKSELFNVAPGAPNNKIASCNWERLWTSVFLGNDLEIKTIKNMNNIHKICAGRR